MAEHSRAHSVPHMVDLIYATATFPDGCLWCVPDCACSYLHSGRVVAPDPGPETRLPWWTEGTKCCPSNPKQQLPSHAQIRSTLRHADCLEAGVIHPVILDPAHQITKLMTQDFNQRLHHSGPERVLAEIITHYYVLHGLEAVMRNQHGCRDCQLWHAKAELRNAFKGMAPDLQDQLAQKMIFICFNPLWAPHLGGLGTGGRQASGLSSGSKRYWNWCWAPASPKSKGYWMPNHLDVSQWMLLTLARSHYMCCTWDDNNNLRSSSCLRSTTQGINRQASLCCCAYNWQQGSGY